MAKLDKLNYNKTKIATEIFLTTRTKVFGNWSAIIYCQHFKDARRNFVVIKQLMEFSNISNYNLLYIRDRN